MSGSAFKVAHVTTVDLSLRYLLLDQLDSLRARGYEVTGISASGPNVATVEAAGVPHIAVEMTRRMTPVADLLALLRLIAIMRRERFDIVHTHTPKAGLLGQLAARVVGVPVVVNTVHGFYFHEHMPARTRAAFVALEKLAARCSHAILMQSSEDVETAQRERIAPPRLVSFLGNGIDLARFDPASIDEASAAALRRELGIEPDERVVGFVGRLVAEKGVPELLEAMATVRARIPRVRLLLVGPIDEDKADALGPASAKAHGVADICVFTGLRPDVPELINVMDLLVLPSHREGFPRVTMEASAMGVPTVATDIRGCREAVVDGDNGLLVPPRDPPALAAAILELLEDPARAAAMGARGREVAEQRFDQARIFEQVAQTYARLIRERGVIPQAASWYRRRGKRMLDLALVVPGGLLLTPVGLVVAALVRTRLGSPVLFRQQRPGLHGQPFELMKFRTMTDARDEHGELLPDAERLTDFGRLLRSTSLDELPTLINVLRGEMTLVGPRPLLMRYLDRYTPRQARRHEVRPGVTGWAQVRGRNAIAWAKKFELDLEYVDEASLIFDLRILAETVVQVLSRSGVSAQGHVTMPEFMGPEFMGPEFMGPEFMGPEFMGDAGEPST